MKRSKTAPTMKDVAREAGVSLGTVSKVVNGIPVGEGYRLRVEAATKRLGYQVNSYARGLKMNRTNCIGIIMPSLRHPFFAALTDELAASLTRRGCRSMLMITNYDPEAERKCFVLMRQNKLDGAIALTYSPDLEPDETLPIVTIDRHFSEQIPCVSSDNLRGGEMAAEKLIELGCGRLLFMRIGPAILGEADKRGAGFENACRLRNAAHEAIYLDDSDGVEPFFRFLQGHIHGGRLDFDGIFCHTDWLAVLVHDYLTRQGIKVPEDVQLIGYDGLTDYATGRLLCSSIIQPLPQMAETAVRILLQPEDGRTDRSIRLPVSYAPGGTTREALH